MQKLHALTDLNSAPGALDFPQPNQENEFVTLSVVFILLWILALGLGLSMGGFIHILLLSAAVMGLIAITQSRHRP
jgi:hypothetical protein